MTDRDFVTEHSRFEFDDAAYLLGALDADATAAFEAHLAICPLCQDSVADLGGVPAVLARADLSAWEEEAPPDSLLPRLLAEVTADRRRRVWRTAGATLVAACLAGALLVGATAIWHDNHRSSQTLAMQSVVTGATDVSATVKLTATGATTRIDLKCGYRSGGNYPAGGSTPSYRMVVFNRLGQQMDLGSWTPAPGGELEIARTSPWARPNLTKIEGSDSQGDPVLRLLL